MFLPKPHFCHLTSPRATCPIPRELKVVLSDLALKLSVFRQLFLLPLFRGFPTSRGSQSSASRTYFVNCSRLGIAGADDRLLAACAPRLSIILHSYLLMTIRYIYFPGRFPPVLSTPEQSDFPSTTGGHTTERHCSCMGQVSADTENVEEGRSSFYWSLRPAIP